jgi:hypothetical protein
MANRGRIAYLVRFIVLCWIATGAVIGFFAALAHFVKSATALIIVFLVALYSCFFGVLGWQIYAWKGKGDGWPSGKRGDRDWRHVQGKKNNKAEKTDDDEPGWKLR